MADQNWRMLTERAPDGMSHVSMYIYKPKADSSGLYELIGQLLCTTYTYKRYKDGDTWYSDGAIETTVTDEFVTRFSGYDYVLMQCMTTISNKEYMSKLIAIPWKYVVPNHDGYYYLLPTITGWKEASA